MRRRSTCMMRQNSVGLESIKLLCTGFRDQFVYVRSNISSSDACVTRINVYDICIHRAFVKNMLAYFRFLCGQHPGVRVCIYGS